MNDPPGGATAADSADEVLRRTVEALAEGRVADAAALEGQLQGLEAGSQGPLGGKVRFRVQLALAQIALSAGGRPQRAAEWLAAAQSTLDAAGDSPGPISRAELAQMQAKLAKEARDFEGAEKRYREALAVLIGEEPQIVAMRAIVLNNLGDLGLRRGRFADAAEAFERALPLSQEPRIRAAGLQNSGRAHARLGRHAEAAEAYRSAAALWRTMPGAESRLAETLGNLATALAGSGMYGPAEDATAEALRLWGDRPDHALGAGTTLSNLAFQYRETGQYSRAREMYGHAREILQRDQPSTDEALAAVVHGLGGLAELTGEHQEAERLMGEAIARFTAIDPRHPDIDVVNRSLAVLYQNDGRLELAESLVAAGLAGPDLANNPEARISWLAMLGGLRHSQGRFGEAVRAALQVVALADAQHSPGDPDLILHHDNLAAALAAAGDLAGALAEADRAEHLRDVDLDARFATMTEGERFAAIRSANRDMHAFLTLALSVADPTALTTAFELVLRRKGVIAEATALALRTPSADAPASAAGTFAGDVQRFKLVRAELGMHLLRRGASDDPSAGSALRAEADELERRLARTTPSIGFAQRLRGVTAASVAEALPRGSALLEIVRYRPSDFAAPVSSEERLGPPRYLAFVLPAGAPGKLRALDLGPAEPIEDAVAAWLRLITPTPEDASLVRAAWDPAAYLSTALVMPLVEAAGKAEHLIIAPDGALARLPFVALSDGTRMLIESRMVTLVDTGRDVLAWARPRPATQGVPYVAGGIDYDAGPRKGEPEAPDRSQLAYGIGPFALLPGMKAEADAVACHIDATVESGVLPLERRVKGLVSPAILHLATHGFFIPLDGAPTVRNPLLRSGVALVGINRALAGETMLPGAEDGVLNAEDVLSMDLGGTDLVVLSACETGLGEIAENEGVFGLRRAFAMAGARALVMSLWSVPDEPTMVLMQKLYAHLAKGEGVGAALWAAQREVRPRFDGIVNWAAFVLAGDPNAKVPRTRGAVGF